MARAAATDRTTLAREWADARIAGRTLDEVGAAYGVSREWVRQVIREAGLTDEVNAARAAERAAKQSVVDDARAERATARRFVVHPAVAEKQFSDAEIIRALREWLEAGGSGATSDWVASGRSPSATVVARRFGWSNAIRAAGGTSRGPGVPRRDRRTAAECVEGIVAFLSDPSGVGGGPEAYRVWAVPRGYPSEQTVRARFGSWRAGKQAALDAMAAG